MRGKSWGKIDALGLIQKGNWRGEEGGSLKRFKNCQGKEVGEKLIFIE